MSEYETGIEGEAFEVVSSALQGPQAPSVEGDASEGGDEEIVARSRRPRADALVAGYGVVGGGRGRGGLEIPTAAPLAAAVEAALPGRGRGRGRGGREAGKVPKLSTPRLSRADA